ncbi:hypothetical protein CIG75_05770 [Tumebacillus algifaecis]|uniref:Single-stranded DNA-binding protein n=1 Tax=Tumebacillus algifaecis TaxID=1214604 RepID=A0A223CYX8_9BACL|nr:hypothetical protein [Tumebacillus algifaecis]ASS74552.1 hypothetical protein CIG75_05770 [Tumebacillus algifaecis]
MNETLVHVEGILVSDPLSYQSVEEAGEVYLAKIDLRTPLSVGEVELTELFLNLGPNSRGLTNGDRVSVTGVVALRNLITRSGKIRRGGVYQLLVQDVRW